MPTNAERLQSEGMILGDLPGPHADVVDGLSDEEVDTLISIKNKLADADAEHGADAPASGEAPHFTSLIVF